MFSRHRAREMDLGPLIWRGYSPTSARVKIV
jgi:hypothetical protein